MTVIARSAPSLNGISGSVNTALMQAMADEVVEAKGLFRLVATWAAVPAKSTAIESPLMVTLARIGTGSSLTPSSSSHASPRQVPSGAAAIADRMRRSEYASISSIAAKTVSVPNFRHNPLSRSPPTAFAANWALMSPIVASGMRTLARTRRSKGPPFQSRTTE